MACIALGTLGGVMVSKRGKQTLTSEFDSHWVPHLCDLVPHLSKKLCKLLYSVVKKAKLATVVEDEPKTPFQ